jgi:hypothetical protein
MERDLRGSYGVEFTRYTREKFLTAFGR